MQNAKDLPKTLLSYMAKLAVAVWVFPVLNCPCPDLTAVRRIPITLNVFRASKGFVLTLLVKESKLGVC